MKTCRGPNAGTGHGTGALQARMLGRRRRMKGVTVAVPEAALVVAGTRRNRRRFPHLFARGRG